MKSSEHLFYLIQSLSKSEKKSFKLIVNQFSKGGSNNYTLLFDVIDQMKEYSHEFLVEKLKNKVGEKNISPLKVQLTNVILKSLRNKYSTSNVNFKVRMYTDYVSILFEKGLYSQAKKILYKAKEIALENELYLALDNLAIWECKIAEKESNKEAIKYYLEETYPIIKNARKLNDLLAEFEYLHAKIRYLLLEGKSYENEYLVSQLEVIIDNPVMKIKVEDYSSSCQIEFHCIWGHYHYAKLNKYKAYHHRKKVLELIPFKPFIIREWLSHARFLLIGLSKFQMYKEYDLELSYITDKIKEVPKEVRTDSFEDELNITLFNINLNNDLTAGLFSKILTYSEDVELLLATSKYQIDSNLKIVFQYNLCYVYIGNNDYKRALFWVNNLLNMSIDLREDLQSYIRIMNICIHYKLGNYTLIESLIQSTTRFLQKNNRYNALESSFLLFSKKYFIGDNFSQLDRKADFVKIELLIDTEKAKESLSLFDLISWLKSSIEDKTMEEIIKVKS